MTQGHQVIPWQETVHLTPFHSIKRAQVWLDVEEAHKLSGSGNNALYMLSKVQLEAIGEAAGFQIVDSKPLTDTPERVVWQVKGQVTGTDGRQSTVIKTYELDMRRKETDGVDGSYIILARQRARESANKILDNPSWRKKWHPELDDAEGWQHWVEDKAVGDWAMTNRHRVRRAETGAALACIRSKLRISSTYNPPDFEKPWVVYRAEFDLQRALAAGGAVGNLALKGVAATLTRSLGVPEEMATAMIAGMAESAMVTDPKMSDLANASEEDIADLEEKMAEIGFKDRASRDRRAIDIFDAPLSQFSQRHVRIMNQYLEIGAAAIAAKLNREEMAKISEALIDAARLAYVEGSAVGENMEIELLDRIFVDQGEGEEEKESQKEDQEDQESEEGQEDQEDQEDKESQEEDQEEDGEEPSEKEEGAEEDEKNEKETKEKK